MNSAFEGLQAQLWCGAQLHADAAVLSCWVSSRAPIPVTSWLQTIVEAHRRSLRLPLKDKKKKWVRRLDDQS